MSDTNGGTDVSLPERRKAAVAAGLEQYNHIANERDKFETEVRELRTQIAGYKVALEADASRIAELESRATTLTLERDQAVADRVKWEGLFVSIKAMLRAFAVPNAPLIKDRSEEADNALEHMALAAKHQVTAQQQLQAGAYPQGFSGHPGVPANVGQRTDNLSKTERSS